VIVHHWTTTYRVPRYEIVAALICDGPIFAAIELLFPHIFLLLAGRPSFWNLHG
jgi:hypothetical protein